MKNKTLTLAFIGIMCLGLVACKDNKVNDISKITIENGTTTEILKREEVNEGFHITQTSEVKGNFSIPDPKLTKKTAEIVIHKCEYKEGKNGFYCTENEPTYDLSFLGFKNRVYVTNYAVGNIAGECLVLALEEKMNKKAIDNYSYIAVLDYKDKKSYVIKTDIIAGQGRDEQLNLCDITGNGKDEIIFSSEPNTVVNWNIYQLAGDKLKKIYSNNDSFELERDGFEIKLLDDYKVKISGRKFNFHQTVSLLDLGYKKSDLEYANPNSLDKSDNERRHIYRNGKLIKKDENNPGTAEIKALMAENWDKGYAEYDYFKKINKKRGICVPLSVVLGDEEIGKLNVYLKYDVQRNGMKIADADFAKNHK